MGVAWMCLFVAGVFEIGWPIGLKLAQTPGRLVPGLVVSVACMALSGLLLYLAQRSIPMGTAYAVWTGIGAAGAFCVGVLFYNDPLQLARVAGVGLIIAGVATLKLAG